MKIKWKSFTYFVAFELLLICCSCTDTTKYDKCYEYEEHILMVRGATCSKQLDTKCILVSDMLAYLGQPEITMKVSELPGLLIQESRDTSRINQIMEDFYGGYLIYLRQTENNIHQWSSSEDFLNLNVLIYHYTDGPEVKICGWPFHKSTGLTYPFYFVTDDTKVLFLERVLRPKHIP